MFEALLEISDKVSIKLNVLTIRPDDFEGWFHVVPEKFSPS